MISTLMMLAHVWLCLLIVCGVVVRAIRMDHETHADVRAAFVALGAAALYGLAAPLVTGFAPDVYSLSITAAICLLQGVTRRYWSDGVPSRFRPAAGRPSCD